MANLQVTIGAAAVTSNYSVTTPPTSYSGAGLYLNGNLIAGGSTPPTTDSDIVMGTPSSGPPGGTITIQAVAGAATGTGYQYAWFSLGNIYGTSLFDVVAGASSSSSATPSSSSSSSISSSSAVPSSSSSSISSSSSSSAISSSSSANSSSSGTGPVTTAYSAPGILMIGVV